MGSRCELGCSDKVLMVNPPLRPRLPVMAKELLDSFSDKEEYHYFMMATLPDCPYFV
jgi:hypothetical protein